MNIRTQVERRLAPTQRLTRYLRTSTDSVRYLGWLGQRNLGDEAVHQALAHYLAPHELAWRPERIPEAMRSRVAKHTHSVTVLGGGTLLGGRYVDDFVTEPDPSRRAIFGAGVIDPSFPHSYRNGTETLDRWIEAIDGIAYLGVRGPLSQQILADRGVTAPILGDPVAAFAMPAGHWQPTRKSSSTGTSPTLGVNVGQSAGGMFGSELDMLKATADTVRSLAAKGWNIEYYVVWPEDLPVTTVFARDVGTRFAPVHKIYDQATDFVSAARHLDAFVGLKLHAVGLAMCAGVPSASIAYQPKCFDLLASLGLERLALRSDNLGGLSTLLEELIDDGEDISTIARDGFFRQQRDQQAAADVIGALI